jgi:DNA-binding GntR family transcriptional regulator
MYVMPVSYLYPVLRVLDDQAVTVDHYAEEPLYRQLAGLLRDRITSGALAPGDWLPSEKRMEQEHGVSRGTVRAALKILAEEGLVTSRSGRGTFVRRTGK